MLYKKISWLIVRDVFSLYGLAAANLIFPILFIPYASSKIGVEQFGGFAVLASILQYGVMVVEFGTTSPLVRFLSSDKYDFIFWDVVVYRFILFFLMFFLVTIAFYFFSGGIDVLVVLISMVTLLGAALSPIAIFQARGKLPIYSSIAFVFRLILAVFSLIILNFNQDVWVVFLFQFIPGFFVSIVALFYLMIRKELTFNRGMGFVKNKELFDDSLSFFIGTVFSSGYTLATPLIISVFFGNYAAGIYGVIDKIVQPIKQVIMPVINIVYPKVCSLLSDGNHNAISFSIKTTIIIFFGCVIFLIVCFSFIDDISLYIFKNSNGDKLLQPIILNVFFVYISQVFVYLFVVPLGKGFLLKKIYSFMLGVFVVVMLFSILLDNVLFLYWALACVEFIGVLLLFYISFISVKEKELYGCLKCKK